MSAATQKKEVDGRTGWLDLYDALPFRESRQSTTIRREDVFYIILTFYQQEFHQPFVDQTKSSRGVVGEDPKALSSSSDSPKTIKNQAAREWQGF